jgi:signal transduction histidine kinase
VAFQEVIKGLIGIFERDRSYIAYEMSKFFTEKHQGEKDQEQARALAKRILERKQEQKNDDTEERNDNSEVPDNEFILASQVQHLEERIEQLTEEQVLLRAMASSGLVMASFTHDLSRLKNQLGSRMRQLEETISSVVKKADYNGIDDNKNPFYLMERMKKNDLKLRNWLNFSLSATRKDKRTRKELILSHYLGRYERDWRMILSERNISFTYTCNEGIRLRSFEVEMDSMLNNLVINSIDSFVRMQENRDRNIRIDIHKSSKKLLVDYYDSGEGLSSDIDPPERIFEALYTTKRNRSTGQAEGTGLGMWIIKTIMEEYDGEVELLFPPTGFGLRLSFPIKYEGKRNV